MRVLAILGAVFAAAAWRFHWNGAYAIVIAELVLVGALLMLVLSSREDNAIGHGARQRKNTVALIFSEITKLLLPIGLLAFCIWLIPFFIDVETIKWRNFLATGLVFFIYLAILLVIKRWHQGHHGKAKVALGVGVTVVVLIQYFHAALFLYYEGLGGQAQDFTPFWLAMSVVIIEGSAPFALILMAILLSLVFVNCNKLSLYNKGLCGALVITAGLGLVITPLVLLNDKGMKLAETGQLQYALLGYPTAACLFRDEGRGELKGRAEPVWVVDETQAHLLVLDRSETQEPVAQPRPLRRLYPSHWTVVPMGQPANPATALPSTCQSRSEPLKNEPSAQSPV